MTDLTGTGPDELRVALNSVLYLGQILDHDPASRSWAPSGLITAEPDGHPSRSHSSREADR
jgi:hypothetical protein